MKAWRWVGGVALVAGIGAAAWWGYGRLNEPQVTYRTAKIERGLLQAAVSATGTVTPVTQVQVGSQVSGQIKNLYADFNSEVRQGQLIAQLDPETFEYRVRQSTADVEASRAAVLTAQANEQSALAQVARARVDLAEAQRDERRKRDLLAQNFISPAELDTAVARTQLAAEALKVAQAQQAVARAQTQNAAAIVRQREAQLAQARIDLERTQIRSPVDGIVIKRSVEVGQTVAASLQAPELFVIARNLSDMQVEAAIDEADISRVRDGQKVSFTIDAFPGRAFEGSVRQVRKAAVSAQNVVSYTVVVGFANPGSLMLPGMTANVRIVTDTRDDVLKVPNAALRVRIAGVEPEPTAPPAAARDGAQRTGAAAGFDGLPTARAQPGQGAGLRDRLVGELQLDAAQQARLDALLAETRPQFAAMPDEDRAAAREVLLGELRRRVDAFLTPQQRTAYAALQARANAATAAAGAAPSASAATAGATPGHAARQAARQANPGAAASAGAAPTAPVPESATVAASAPPPVAAGAAAPPPDLPASGPLADFRQRLIAELGLNAAQVARVDGIIAAQRPRFADLRNLPENQRGKARDRILADMRALIAAQLDPPQQAKYQRLLAEMAGRQVSRGRIYLLPPDGKPRAYDVRLGITDGVMTELVVPPGSPDAAVLVEGATVITAVIQPGAAATPARTTPTPFGPRVP